MIVGMIIGAASNATPGTASGMAASNGRTAPSNGKTHTLKASKENGTAGFGWLSPASPHMRVTETLVQGHHKR